MSSVVATVVGITGRAEGQGRILCSEGIEERCGLRG